MKNNYVWIGRPALTLIIVLATLLALVLDIAIGPRLDNIPHDIVSVSKPRGAWQHVGIVAVDDKIPLNVGRTQMLPLFALATQRLVSAGATAVYLDARVPLTLDPRLPFAKCINTDDQINWSLPRCAGSDGDCSLRSSRIGRLGPLNMPKKVFERFYFAPPHVDSEPAKYWALFGRQVSSSDAIKNTVLDRLVFAESHGGDGVARWYDYAPRHAVMVMASSTTSLSKQPAEICTLFGKDQTACGRVRQGPFTSKFDIELADSRALLPLSKLVSCGNKKVDGLKNRVNGRAIILQTTAPLEPIDFHTTPMTTTINGDAKLSSGPQFLADAVDTQVLGDGPRLVNSFARLVMYLLAIVVSLGAVFLIPTYVVVMIPISIGSIIFGLSYLSFPSVLYPIFGPVLVSVFCVMLVYIYQRKASLKDAKIVSHYLPDKVRSIVLGEGVNNSTFSQGTESAVLISDIAGYTGFTSLVRDPEIVFRTINQYLDQVSQQVQSECGGWLEGYTGDEVCFYWPVKYDEQAKLNALKASLSLEQLQHAFFNDLLDDEHINAIPNAKRFVQEKMMSGIGVSFGSLVMGNIGPLEGVKKFGILGDPLNLSARLESLTRSFSAKIILSSAFIDVANDNGYQTRYLGCIRVKGRMDPEKIYELIVPRNQPSIDEVSTWEGWITKIEETACWVEYPGMHYQKDVASVNEWFEKGLLDRSSCAWYLDQK
jgi:adenylate cyclase